jgi:hypothetical protein
MAVDEAATGIRVDTRSMISARHSQHRYAADQRLAVITVTLQPVNVAGFSTQRGSTNAEILSPAKLCSRRVHVNQSGVVADTKPAPQPGGSRRRTALR